MQKHTGTRERETTGRGRLVRAGRRDIEVEYELRTAEDNFMLQPTDNRTGESLGKRVEGTVRGPEDELRAIAGKGEMWTLVLATGHNLDVIVQSDGTLSPQSALRGKGEKRAERDRAPEM